MIDGKSEGKQRYALEFFIKFNGEDRSQEAAFKVWYCHANGKRRASMTAKATLAEDAD
jgi:hypothetical protein